MMRVCKWCGTDYDATAPGDYRRTHCGESCYRKQRRHENPRCKTAANKRYWARIRNGERAPPRRLAFAHICQQCGSPFHATRTAQFCSQSCVHESRRRPPRVRWSRVKPYRVFEPIKCKWCGWMFRPRNMRNTKFCTSACKRAEKDRRFKQRRQIALDVVRSEFSVLLPEPKPHHAPYADRAAWEEKRRNDQIEYGVRRHAKLKAAYEMVQVLISNMEIPNV